MEHHGESSAPELDSEHFTSQYDGIKAHLLKVNRHNLRTFRNQPLAEISGSFGDMGTLLPLLIALAVQHSISLPTTLVFSGLANIFTGLAFGLPLPVQPMKAIAAVAIAQSLTLKETVSAGIFVAAAIAFLSITGLIRWFTNVIPLPIIKGIQLGTGLSLIIAAGPIYKHNTESNWVVFLAFLGLLISTTIYKRLPYALVVLIVGIIVIVVFYPNDKDYIPLPDYPVGPGQSHPNDSYDTEGPWFRIWYPHTTIPSPQDFAKGVIDAGIGQLPLTTLNSVIAVTFLAADLFPPATTVPTPSTTAVGLSVAAANLIGCWFGAMPVCHGSGGLAAQYRFGARSGASVIFLGLVKLLLGLFASPVAQLVVGWFPASLLCVLLVAAGLELSLAGEGLNTARARDLADHVTRQRREGEWRRQFRSVQQQQRHGDDCFVSEDVGEAQLHAAAPPEDEELDVRLTEEQRRRRWTVMMTTVGGILAFKNDAVGFIAGMLCHWFFQWEERREQLRGIAGLGQIRLGQGTEAGVEGRRDEASA